ncbi:uncharacterized protein MAM_02729 [Metarhizium album ARSEF 1941]|uniref:AoPex11B-like protein n=1 Tax=Metarhizium album (strain ARSEF 1941) TaxID=1081103 RepID=A0A0B2WSI0_METAS|nr:uncharacterized protein MAM_02729 [Metarhizium album ARSEF 1941]KHN99031.1 hypothetical protein MAM_02729 [Metarhizium album ARSEF 1941]
MAGHFEQFVAFGTDIVGLERIMRFIQSVISILTSYPALIPILLSHRPPAAHKTGALVMGELCDLLNMTRRAIRLFWCLGSFQSSWNVYVVPEKSTEDWLFILADSFFGLFGLMESVTLLDLLQVRGLSVFGLDEAVRIDGQSKSVWLAALVCSALCTGVKIFKTYVERAVPETGSGFGAATNEKTSGKGDEKTPKAAAVMRRQQREAASKETSRKVRALTRKLLADLLDMAIPAWATGLADIHVGTVCVAMLFSTVLTGYAVWERCGQAIDQRRS